MLKEIIMAYRQESPILEKTSSGPTNSWALWYARHQTLGNAIVGSIITTIIIILIILFGWMVFNFGLTSNIFATSFLGYFGSGILATITLLFLMVPISLTYCIIIDIGQYIILKLRSRTIEQRHRTHIVRK